ncbi:MAG TPA: uracil-DNA glycosylase family protein [Alphaproteobacteria bacterium]|jgi:uracil-DNA glycosylase
MAIVSAPVKTSPRKLAALLKEVRACRLCEAHLPLGPLPVVRAAVTARLLIVGQAPGTKVHATGVPWNDPSGDRLRDWLGLDRDAFYDESGIAIVPAGLCYPGRTPKKGKSGGGDAPPRPECAPKWHPPLRALMPHVGLTLLVGSYAQAYYLGPRRGKTLAETVERWRDYLPDFLPMPHPSPRNRLWLRKHPWFEAEVVPALRSRVKKLLAEG